MPYADRERQREAQARWYRLKRAKEAAFREAEEKRVAKWKKKNRAALLERMKEYTRRWRKTKSRKKS